MNYCSLLISQIILLLFIFIAGCTVNESLNEIVIDSNAVDDRFIPHTLDSAIHRRHLRLPALRTTSYNFQYLNEDEWGMYFSLIRFDSKSNKILLVEQDSFNRFHSIFEYTLSHSEGKTITEYLLPITNGTLHFPDPARNLLDGGDVSVTYFQKDTFIIRHWQENERLVVNDKAAILAVIDSVRAIAQRRKRWWQE